MSSNRILAGLSTQELLELAAYLSIAGYDETARVVQTIVPDDLNDLSDADTGGLVHVLNQTAVELDGDPYGRTLLAYICRHVSRTLTHWYVTP